MLLLLPDLTETFLGQDAARRGSEEDGGGAARVSLTGDHGRLSLDSLLHKDIMAVDGRTLSAPCPFVYLR